jgi:hypothetical protein
MGDISAQNMPVQLQVEFISKDGTHIIARHLTPASILPLLKKNR